jgi:hypothetical protein
VLAQRVRPLSTESEGAGSSRGVRDVVLMAGYVGDIGGDRLIAAGTGVQHS